MVGFTGVVVVVGLTDTELDLETGGGAAADRRPDRSTRRSVIWSRVWRIDVCNGVKFSSRASGKLRYLDSYQ